MIIRFVLILALMAAAAATTGDRDDELLIDPLWSGSKVWDDGLAEVAHYEAHRRVYSVDRTFETITITVKEDFDRAVAVKADPPYEGRDLLGVLKLNIISRIQTENYPYQYMTSVFVQRDDPRLLVKLASSSQEWCGTTFKEVVTWDGPARLEFHSYFDGQADGSWPLTLNTGSLLEEQLPLVMRAARLASGRSYRLLVHEPLIANTAGRPSAREVVVALVGTERLTTPSGAFETRRIDMKAADGSAGPAMSFWIEQGDRRALVKLESSDGRSLLLTRISRRDYWSRR